MLEINLKGKNDGIWLANQIREHLNIPLIYITAYDDFGLMEQLIRTDPSGYIMKPYTKSALRATISIAYSKFRQLNQLLNNEKHKTVKINYVLVNKGALKIKLAFDQVLFIESDGNYVEYHTSTKVFRERSKLKDIEELVAFQGFVRINKGLLINLSKATGYTNEHIFIGEKCFPVSRLHRKNIKDYFRL